MKRVRVNHREYYLKLIRGQSAVLIADNGREYVRPVIDLEYIQDNKQENE